MDLNFCNIKPTKIIIECRKMDWKKQNTIFETKPVYR